MKVQHSKYPHVLLIYTILKYWNHRVYLAPAGLLHK